MSPESKTIEIKDINNTVKGTMSLSGALFNSDASEAVVHSAVVSTLANQRQGTHATKTRGMVRGGGKKPWKQKHTGRARHGSTRSPIWRGGGTTFGPQPRDYSIRLPKNVRKAALSKALTMKLADGEIAVIDTISLQEPKTAAMVKILGNLGFSNRKVLIVLAEYNKNTFLSARNIPGVDVVRFAELNAYDIAAYNYLLFTADAMKKLQGSEEA
ncbi:MAG: 50S ribosomal protein L4 [Nitrospirales bacterium]|nr:50S ribosomal protein L4 [Nitrospirales bacterium]